MKKRGFTLIELLAVIVILAIIALIATPIILNMINNARKSAAVDSAYGYIEAVEYNNSMNMINKDKYPLIEDGEDIDISTITNINIKGTKPDSGKISISKKRVVSASLCISGYTVEYDSKKAEAIGKCNEEKKEEIIIKDPNMVFKINAKESPIFDKVFSKYKDMSGNNNDATINNLKFNDEKDGVIFDGSSYAKVSMNKKIEKTELATLDIVLSTTSSSNCVVYIDPYSGMAFGIWNKQFIVVSGPSSSVETNTFTIPSDFFDGTKKHLIILYDSTKKNNKLYLEGTELVKSSSTNYFYESDNTVYIGRRSSGNYFNGTLYALKLYNKNLDNTEIEKSFNNADDSKTINKDNLILDYYVKNNEKNLQKDIIGLKDSISNNSINMYGIKYDEETDGLLFNGNTSYAEITNAKSYDEMTLELVLKHNSSDNCVVYIDSVSGIVYGIYNNTINITVNLDSKLYNLPDNYFNGKAKYIVVLYDSTRKDNKLYIDGIEITPLSSTDRWNNNNNTTYIGKRVSDSRPSYYFNGTLYDLNIYNKKISEDDIKNNYKKYNEKYHIS